MPHTIEVTENIFDRCCSSLCLVDTTLVALDQQLLEFDDVG
jgi:hypothetical protein